MVYDLDELTRIVVKLPIGRTLTIFSSVTELSGILEEAKLETSRLEEGLVSGTDQIDKI